MSGALAATFVTFGVVAISWAAMIWKKRREHKKWVPFLMVVAGLLLGTGVGYLANVNVIDNEIGYVPVWVPFTLIVGFGFLLEIRGWKDHPERTPVLGFITAFMLMLAAGQAVVSAASHEVHNVQVTSRFAQTGGKG